MTTQLEKASQGSRWIYISKIITFGLGFLFSIFLVRWLTPEEYGSYQFIKTLQIFLTYVLALGIDSVVTRFIPEFLEKRQVKGTQTLMALALTIRAMSVLLVLMGAYAISTWLFAFFNFPPLLQTAFVFVCLYLFLNQIELVLGPSFLNAHLEQRLLSVSTIIKSAIQLLFLTVFVFFLEQGFNGLLKALIGMELIILVLYGIFTLRIVLQHRVQKASNTSPISKLDYTRIGKFALVSVFLNSISFLQEIMVDNFVIAHYMDMSSVGLYGFAASILTTATFFNPGIALKGVFSHLLIRKYTETNDKSYLVYGNNLIIKLSCYIVFPSFICLGVLLDPVIRYVYDPHYLDTIPVIRTLLLFFLVNGFSYGLGHILFVLEKVHYRLYTIGFAVLNLILDILWVPRYGIMGAAWATGLVTVLVYLYYLIVIRFRIQVLIQFPWKGVFKILINSLITAGVVALMAQWITGIHSLFSVILLGFLFYLALASLNKAFDTKDRDYIQTGVGRKLWFI